jgi:hypothetical protein
MNGYNRENYSCLKPTNTFTVPAVKAPVIYSDEEEEEEEEKPVFEERKILPGFALLKKMAKLDKKIKKKNKAPKTSQLDLDVLEKSFKTVLGRF